MAAPPGDDPRIYSPSKLTALPDTYLTPSNDSLNNSGAYAPAVQGPITASGHGPPARRDGLAFWDDNAPTPHPILISSNPPSPAAGRSPQDSLMGSPESEEPTLPAILSTQIGPNTQLALQTVLPSPGVTDSQQLWANVPSLPSDLPPQPEVIEVRGRATPTSNKTPRARSRAMSNASVWSHATMESNVSDAAEPSIPKPPSSTNFTFKWHTLAAAIRAGFLSDPMDPNAISMTGYDPDGDEDGFLAEINTTLEAEIRQDVSAVLQGWSTYKLLHPVELRRAHDLPTTANEFNCMVNCVLTALDAGAASHDGETMVKALSPQSWMRLALAILAAILRGALRSPAALRSGSRSLNGVDQFPLHKDLEHPLTEGGAIMLMCQQLGGLYTSNRNHPDKSYPDSYFNRLTTLLDSRMHQVPLSSPQAPTTSTPLTEADKAQVDAATRERLILAGIETMRLDADAMQEIREAVKAEIFANMNAEALENIDDWRAVYKHEFTEAMHDAFETQYPGIHPNKGKTKATAPITHSQVVKEAQPRIQEEVRIQVQARISGIHDEIKQSIANGEPFWSEGPLREAIANELRTKMQATVQQELEEEINALKATAQGELEAMRTQIQWEQDKAHNELHEQAKEEYEQAKKLFAANLEADIQEFKTTISNNVKEWKDTYRTARNLTALKREALRFGFKVVPANDESSTAEKAALRKYTLTPLEVEGRDLSAEPPSPAQPTNSAFHTPDNLPHTLPDTNVTPTPVRVKRTRTDDETLPSPARLGLFAPSSPFDAPSEILDLPLLPPTPMEEDADYALEVLTDRLYTTGPGIHASDHAQTIIDPAPHSRVHSPSVPPQGAARNAPSGQQPTAPIPVTLTGKESELEEPARAPQPPQSDPLAAILLAINATIAGLETRLSERLDAQDKHIQALTTATSPPKPTTIPPVTGKRAKGKETVAAPPCPNTPSTPLAAGETTMGPVPRVDDPASHDRVEEILTPGAQASAQPAPPQQPTVVREAFQPPPEKHVRLNVDAQGKPTPATSMPPSWANVVTKTATAQQAQGAQQAKAVTSGTYRSGTGKARPEMVARRKQSGNTEATVIRHHGLEDIAFELTIRKMTPASIINETRSEVDRLTGGKIVLLSGCWSSNPNKTIHNFVYTFKGQVPFHALYPLRDVLVKPLMTGQLVPNDGWTFAQIRDTTTSGPDGAIYSGTQLEDELRHNPAFENAIFCIAPHWQGSMHKVSTSPRGTVKFAYVDEDGKITTQAKRDGVFLFNEKTRFVPTGDIATIVLCGRCHRIGHTTDSPACPLPPHAVRCFICRGAHHSDHHATHCLNQHDKVGECRCLFPCINCGGGHNARSPHCKLKMGFTPPALAPPPSTGAHDTPTKPSAKGKERAAPTEDLVPTQRETAPLADSNPQTPFTVVSRKRNRKGASALAKQKKQALTNASVPGSAESLATNTQTEQGEPSSTTPASSGNGRKTSKVPARPVRTFPAPPTWHEAPVIFNRHVASDLECSEALQRIFRHEPTVAELRSLHVAWGGHDTDEEITALWTLHFRWAVKYGLPLTTEAAKNKIIHNSIYKAGEALKRFEEDWGPVGPRTYLLSTIPREQYFSHPGDLEEEVISPDEAASNCDNARTLVNTILQFKQLEAKVNNTVAPPHITELVVEALLDTYSFNGTYSFFGIALAGSDNTIWDALVDMHTTATNALDAYA
ncbi:hypothetical protein EDB86DRAFT_3086048 [Lactarius hatsudake]|nr:hypothetical protein EDB86DRAFT_3086048 [Lactarius hatsudake]